MTMDQRIPERPVASKEADGVKPEFVTQQISGRAPTRRPEEDLRASGGSWGGFYRENRIYFWLIVLGLALISVLSYFAFRPQPQQPGRQAKINLFADAPEAVPAGGEAVFRVQIGNSDSVKLVGLSLELNYGEGLSYLSSSPVADNLSGTSFSVPDLTPGQNAVVVVKARASGNINDSRSLQLKLRYRLANSQLEFAAEAVKTVRLTAADMVLEISGPAAANNAQLVVYTVSYQNNSSREIPGSRLRLSYPPGFVFASAQPAPDIGGDVWTLGKLAAGASGQVIISGSFASANPGESRTLEAAYEVSGQGGQYFRQASANFVTAISSLPLLVSQALEERDNNETADPGEVLRYRIEYRNNANTAVRGVNIQATLDSIAIDWSSVKAEGGQVSNNTILWNAASVAALENLNPGEGGQLSFSARIKNPATRDSSKNLSVSSSIKIKSVEYETDFPGNTVSVKISSPAKLTASVAYQSGSQPPQVGQSTWYAVTLSLSNATNDFSNGLVTAFLPLGAGGFVAASVSPEESARTSYDQSTGKLTWQVGALPAHTGQFSAPRVLRFSVQLNPSSAQVGSQPILLKEIGFTATDSYTQQDIALRAADLSTASVTERGGGTTVQP